MSGIENTIIARYERDGQRFEVLVDPEKGYDYKTGATKDFNGVLVFDEVFKDANKGERQSEDALKKAFGTFEPRKAAKLVLEKGELQLTTDQRRKATEKKRARVISTIAKNCVNPQTKSPHPPQRIENAFEQLKIKIDPMKGVEEQLPGIIEKLREILPISTDDLRVAITVPAQYAAKCYGALKEYGLTNEEWTSTGSLKGTCRFPAGMQGEFYDKVNKATGGNVQTSVL
jgi:ribosome maturation protein SDO1